MGFNIEVQEQEDLDVDNNGAINLGDIFVTKYKDNGYSIHMVVQKYRKYKLIEFDKTPHIDPFCFDPLSVINEVKEHLNDSDVEEVNYYSNENVKVTFDLLKPVQLENIKVSYSYKDEERG